MQIPPAAADIKLGAFAMPRLFIFSLAAPGSTKNERPGHTPPPPDFETWPGSRSGPAPSLTYYQQGESKASWFMSRWRQLQLRSKFLLIASGAASVSVTEMLAGSVLP